MNRFYILILGLFVFFSCDTIDQEINYPNIIFILADDLGYGELGVFGQKLIETPNLDALAMSGMILTDHYSGSPVCAPSRAILMTGLHSGHNPIRANGELNERGNVLSFKSMFENPNLEGQRPLPDSIVTVASILKQKGYITGMVGKWGLGAPNTSSVPNKKGFDFFYGYNCQRQAHNLFPSHLWKNGERHILNNTIINKGRLADSLDPNDENSYTIYHQNDYAPLLMQNEVLAFLDRNKMNKFFLYYATPLPHLPLQAPKNWVKYYREKFGPEKPYLGEKGYFPNFTPRATYAAMISYLDEQIGELVQRLKKNNQFENTLIIFSSDNGPTHKDEQVDIHFFNSTGIFVNSKETVKGNVNEGGIRVPSFAFWPNRIRPGSVSNHPCVFYDFFATVCDIVSENPPYTIDGLSYLPTLIGEKQNNHEFLYWEFPAYSGQQAIRIKNWKAMKKNLFKGPSRLKLFNLENDKKEINDLAEDFPEIVKRMEELMNISHEKPSLEKFVIPVLEN